MRHLRSGGRFVLGSVLEDDEYNSGRQVGQGRIRIGMRKGAGNLICVLDLCQRSKQLRQ